MNRSGTAIVITSSVEREFLASTSTRANIISSKQSLATTVIQQKSKNHAQVVVRRMFVTRIIGIL